MQKEYIKVLKKDIEDFFEDMLDKGMISKDNFNQYWMEHYSIEDYFIDSWILGNNVCLEDFYLGDNQPTCLGDKEDSIDTLQQLIINAIKQRLEEYIDLLKA